jgi:hypothetical protein
VLRTQPELAGPVASDPVVSWLITALVADSLRALRLPPVSRLRRWPALAPVARRVTPAIGVPLRGRLGAGALAQR